MTLSSVLGSQSQLYREKRAETGSILDIPEKGLLELWPAGYTHTSNKGDYHRQDVYKMLWEAAVSHSVEDHLYPFGKDNHKVIVEHDPTNNFDENALQVYLVTTDCTPFVIPKPGMPNKLDMGFIPKKINKIVLKNIDMLNSGRILKVRANFHKKYWTAKVVFGYNETTFSPLSVVTMNRFSAILEE
jgi:hypothetical protein